MPSVFNALLCSRFVYLFLSDSFSPPPFVGLNVAPLFGFAKFLDFLMTMWNLSCTHDVAFWNQ